MHGALKIPLFGKIFGGAEQHRRVPVMAAGVHLAVLGRAVREVVQLLDRQSVHIGAQPDRRRRIAAPDRPDHPGTGEPAMQLDPVFGELGGDEIGGAPLGEGQQAALVAGDELLPRPGVALADLLDQEPVAVGRHGFRLPDPAGRLQERHRKSNGHKKARKGTKRRTKIV